MKKYILISFLFLSLQFWGQQAQNDITSNLDKGHFLIGLSSSNFNFQHILNSDETGEKGQTFYSGDLSALYLASKNFGIGAFVSYRYNDFLEFYNAKRYYMVIGPQLRVYLNSKSKIAPFIEAGGGYIDFLKVDTDGYLFNATLGSSFFLNKNIAVDAGINYMHSSTKSKFMQQETSSSTNGFGFQLGFSLFL